MLGDCVDNHGEQAGGIRVEENGGFESPFGGRGESGSSGLRERGKGEERHLYRAGKYARVCLQFSSFPLGGWLIVIIQI